MKSNTYVGIAFVAVILYIIYQNRNNPQKNFLSPEGAVALIVLLVYFLWVNL